MILKLGRCRCAHLCRVGWCGDLEIMFQHFLNAGLLATQAEIEELTVVLGHAPRSYEAFIKRSSAGLNAGLLRRDPFPVCCLICRSYSLLWYAGDIVVPL